MWLELSRGWDKWEETVQTTPCSSPTPYQKSPDGSWRGAPMHGLRELTAQRFRCVSVMGYAKTLKPELLGKK